MGASFQAPCATPRQRLMEIHHILLIIFVFQYASMTNHSGMYKIEKKENDKRIIIIIMKKNDNSDNLKYASMTNHSGMYKIEKKNMIKE